MNFGNNAAALDRLILIIEIYRDLKASRFMLTHLVTIDTHLKEHLSTRDWIFWHSLTVEEREVLRTVGTVQA